MRLQQEQPPLTEQQEQQLQQLHQAVLSGNTEVVLKLIAANVDINLRGQRGETALRLACEERRVDMVQLLLSKSTDGINAIDEYGITSLMVGCENGCVDIVRLLLAVDTCDIDIQDRFGETALMFASRKGHADVVQLLLQNKCNINIKEAQGADALKQAVMFNQPAIVRLLLQAMADVDQTLDNGLDSLAMAVKKGYEEIVNLFLFQNPGPNLNAQYQSGDTLAMLAVHSALNNPMALNCLTLLLLAKANVNQQNIYGDACLHTATRYEGNLAPQVIASLIAQKAYVDMQGRSGQTPLDLAMTINTIQDNSATIAALVKAGVFVPGQEDSDKTVVDVESKLAPVAQ